MDFHFKTISLVFEKYQTNANYPNYDIIFKIMQYTLLKLVSSNKQLFLIFPLSLLVLDTSANTLRFFYSRAFYIDSTPI